MARIARALPRDPVVWRRYLRSVARVRLRQLHALLARFSAHDRHWRAHPAVKTAGDLTLGERAADAMKTALSTWTALLLILTGMAVWIATGGLGHDAEPFILLNLCLSCLAALQCFILLIAAKRADQIAAAVALHTLDNTERLKQLIEQNTALTEQVATLTRAVHDHIAAPQPPVATPSPTTRARKQALP